MQTLFIYNKPVILSSASERTTQDFSTYRKIFNPDTSLIFSQLQLLKKDDTKGLYIQTNESKKIFNAILAHFQHWQAAGGLILNPSGEILLMFRKGKWDLPKGKMEAGERPEETALREITEETGLKNIKIIKKLTETWHSYPTSVYNEVHKDQKDILKQTHWFQIDFTGDELTVPQIEEDIIDIQWIKQENINHYLIYSYPNLKQVFHSAGIIS